MTRRVYRYDKDGVHVVADVNTAVSTGGVVRSSTRGHVVQGPRKERAMPEDTDVRTTDGATDELSPEELEEQGGEELPDREAMSLINANLAAPVNAAVALNVLSDDSVAIANAEQSGTIDQSIG